MPYNKLSKVYFEFKKRILAHPFQTINSQDISQYLLNSTYMVKHKAWGFNKNQQDNSRLKYFRKIIILAEQKNLIKREGSYWIINKSENETTTNSQ